MVPEEPETPSVGDAENNERRIHPFVFILALLLVMGFALGGWVWFGRQASPQEPAAASPTADPLPADAGDVGDAGEIADIADIDDIPGDGFGLVLGPATPWAVPGGPGEIVTVESATVAAPTATPVMIQLFGPPSDSVYRLGDVISFYWSAPVELVAGQQYIVYLIAGDERIALGAAVEPNLGLGYQLQASVGEFVEQAGAYRWLVVLENRETGAIIGQSATRSFMVVNNN